ncbi:MAG TPA: hypothetical protein RMI62_12085, partial [Polyangiaceae bacterium LLY-WYZ-15_(1-7)]|nr:hypothetical protein [Polyangiaceae bacterium LLY-WYZ-15_(1-7)]
GLAALGLAISAAWPARGQERSEHVHHRLLRVEQWDGEAGRVLLTYPRREDYADHPPGERYPLVVALHGLGEARKGTRLGPLGWAVDYALPDAFAALGRGRLTRGDYGGMVTDAHLAAVNEALGRAPFRGVAVVAPYTPALGGAPEEELEAYLAWLAGPLLEQVRAQFPQVAQTAAGTGVDGVSLGGWLALEAGVRHPEAFGAVGGIQPAIRDRVEAIGARAEGLRGKPIRLLTSEADPYLAPTRALSRRLRGAALPHSLIVTPGDHSYAYNRGPGAVELLRFHDRVLARESYEEP